jgi:hypothetical protein
LVVVEPIIKKKGKGKEERIGKEGEKKEKN